MTKNNDLKKDTILDITHEALLRNWGKLDEWAWEEHEREIIFHELESQLDKWLKNDKSTEHLLSAGSLSYFEKWYNGIDVNKDMWLRRYISGNYRSNDAKELKKRTDDAIRRHAEIKEYLVASKSHLNRKRIIEKKCTPSVFGKT